LDFNCVNESFSSTFREKGSKFLSFVIPVYTEETIHSELKSIRSAYPDATHHCYAWRIHPEQIREFAQDDGEPSGSAGLPILNRLRSYSLINTLGIVVRYYGGTKLGKSGLVKAYSHGIDLTMENAPLMPVRAYYTFTICYPYDESKLLEHLFDAFNVRERKVHYTDAVAGEYVCPAGVSDDFESRLLQLEWIGVTVKRGTITYLSGE
jgi:uncharacterized YigZ family protein